MLSIIEMIDNFIRIDKNINIDKLTVISPLTIEELASVIFSVNGNFKVFNILKNFFVNLKKNELSNFSTSKPLLVLDLANNHNGSVDHGKRIIQELKGINILRNFTVAIKFQYRNLPEFIHPEYRMRTDLKYIDRFTSTKLGWDDYLELKQEVEIAGFLTACTPFDEYSVDKIIEHGFDF